MNTLRLVLALIFAAILVGCPHWEEGSTAHVYIDSSALSVEQMKQIEAALQEWETATDGHISFEIVDSAENADITLEGAPHAEIFAEYGKDAITLSGPSSLGGEVILPIDAHSDGFRAAALHEIGHALGLDHSDDPNAVMNASASKGHGLTCEDVSLFCETNDCDAETLPLCK